MTFSLAAITQSVDAALAPLGAGEGQDPAVPEPPGPDPVGAIGAAAAGVMGVMALPTELANTGLAVVTQPLAAMLPAFPAATLGSLYVGVPHAHAHPPSLIPPAPPIPLPSMGSIMFGTAVNVLIAGAPAARAGDLGLAPTCGGLAPFFTIMLGSSKVFFGGMRAARVTDMCTACTPAPTAGIVRAGKRALKAAAKVHASAQQAALVAGLASDLVDIATEQAAVASATAIGVAMQAAEMAADMAADAMTAAMGTDPALPPALPGFITTGASNVLVAGMPLPNVPDLAQLLFKRVRASKKSEPGEKKSRRKRKGGGCGCAG